VAVQVPDQHWPDPPDLQPLESTLYQVDPGDRAGPDRQQGPPVGLQLLLGRLRHASSRLSFSHPGICPYAGHNGFRLLFSFG